MIRAQNARALMVWSWRLNDDIFWRKSANLRRESLANWCKAKGFHMTLPETMRAMVTMGHGDLDQMVFHEDWPRPDPGAGEVLIRVRACGLNNTDVNTRSG